MEEEKGNKRNVVVVDVVEENNKGDVRSMWGRCGVDVGSKWGRFEIDIGSMW